MRRTMNKTFHNESTKFWTHSAKNKREGKTTPKIVNVSMKSCDIFFSRIDQKEYKKYGGKYSIHEIVGMISADIWIETFSVQLDI